MLIGETEIYFLLELFSQNAFMNLFGLTIIGVNSRGEDRKILWF